MTSLRQSYIAFVLLAFAATVVERAAAAIPAVPVWQPHDFAFSATVTAPDGKTLALPGFFDGDGTWKIRVSPTAAGEWSLATQSTLPELQGKTAALTAVTNPGPNAHGALRVDPAHPHHFMFADGTRFFLQA